MGEEYKTIGWEDDLCPRLSKGCRYAQEDFELFDSVCSRFHDYFGRCPTISRGAIAIINKEEKDIVA